MSEIEKELYEFWEKNVSEVNNFRLSGENSRTIKWLIKETMNLLSQPRPFDVLAHLRGGGVATNVVVKLRLHNGHIQTLPRSGVWITNCNNDLLDLIFNKDEWQPYTEPQLEDGWYWVESKESQESDSGWERLHYPQVHKDGKWDSGRGPERLRPVINPTTNLPWRIETPEDSK